MNADRTAVRAVVLVEGHSDRIALQTLALRCGRDLAADGIEVVAMGGITNTRAFASRYGPRGLDLPLAGLYDVADEAKLRRGLAAAGLGADLEPQRLPDLGFYKCSADLEDELIRALGVDAVEAVIAAQGELHSFRSLQKQPAWRGRPVEAQLRRFFGSGATRKVRYARYLADTLDPASVPRPLRLLLAHVL